MSDPSYRGYHKRRNYKSHKTRRVHFHNENENDYGHQTIYSEENVSDPNWNIHSFGKTIGTPPKRGSKQRKPKLVFPISNLNRHPTQPTGQKPKNDENSNKSNKKNSTSKGKGKEKKNKKPSKSKSKSKSRSRDNSGKGHGRGRGGGAPKLHRKVSEKNINNASTLNVRNKVMNVSNRPTTKSTIQRTRGQINRRMKLSTAQKQRIKANRKVQTELSQLRNTGNISAVSIETNSALASKLENFVSKCVTLDDAFKMLSSDPWATQMAKQVHEELNDEIRQSKRRNNSKHLVTAMKSLRMGITHLNMGRLNRNKRFLNKAIHNLSRAICTLPPIGSNFKTSTAERARMVSISNQLRTAYRDAYYCRALAYYLSNRYNEFEKDAMVALQLCNNQHRFYLTRAYVVELAKAANRFALQISNLKAKQSPLSSNEMIMLNNARSHIHRLINRAVYWISMSAYIDRDNIGKLSRLMEMFLTIKEYGKMIDDLSGSDSSQKEKKKSAGGSIQSKGSNNATGWKPMKFTNALERITIDPNHMKIYPKQRYEPKKVIFFERMIAFSDGGLTRSSYQFNRSVRFCGQCCKMLRSVVFPCSGCSTIVFCGPVCAEQAIHTGGRHTYSCRFDSTAFQRLGRTGYLAYQLLTYSHLAHIIRCTIEQQFPSTMVSKLNNKAMLEEAKTKNNFWRTTSLALLIVMRYHQDHMIELKLNDPEKRWQILRILPRAVYIYVVILAQFNNRLARNKVNDANEVTEKKEEKSDAEKKEEATESEIVNHEVGKRALFSISFLLMWFVEFYPFARSNPLSRPLRLKRNQNRFKRNGQRRIIFGHGFGAIGGLLRFGCKGNVYRRYNPRRGTIEYVSKEAIDPTQALTIDWGLSRKKYYDDGSGNNEKAIARANTLKEMYGITCRCDLCKPK